MINSKVVEKGTVSFPGFMGEKLYMHPIFIEDAVSLPNKYFNKLISQMLAYSPIKSGKAYVTIDQKVVKAGKSHRRGGPHVDGNYLFGWGGNGWLTGTKGRKLPRDKHMAQYCSKKGGTLIASDYSLCKAWNGKYDDIPKQGGDCSHFELKDSFYLDKNKVYLLGSTGIHESVPSDKTVKRTLVRITLPCVNMEIK